MRSILFKAKKLSDGKWVKGSLVKTPFGTFIEWYEDSICNKREVDTDTVCQSTGLKDCKGNEIWENDVIELRTGTQLIVMWDTNSCRFSLHKRGCGDVTFPFCKTTAKDFKVIKSKFDKEK